MAKTVIHVNQHRIKANRKHCTNEPVITVKSRSRNQYGRSVTIHGPARVVYSPEKPLSCGATCWIETYAEVEVE